MKSTKRYENSGKIGLIHEKLFENLASSSVYGYDNVMIAKEFKFTIIYSGKLTCSLYAYIAHPIQKCIYVNNVIFNNSCLLHNQELFLLKFRTQSTVVSTRT